MVAEGNGHVVVEPEDDDSLGLVVAEPRALGASGHIHGLGLEGALLCKLTISVKGCSEARSGETR